MWYVYVLKSNATPFRYVGSTTNITRRVWEHNQGLTQSTKAYRPLSLEAYVAIRTEEAAKRLEKYFKTGSGKVVLRKRILGLNGSTRRSSDEVGA